MARNAHIALLQRTAKPHVQPKSLDAPSAVAHGAQSLRRGDVPTPSWQGMLWPTGNDTKPFHLPSPSTTTALPVPLELMHAIHRLPGFCRLIQGRSCPRFRGRA